MTIKTKAIYEYEYAPGKKAFCLLDSSSKFFDIASDGRTFVTDINKRGTKGMREHDGRKFTEYFGGDGHTYEVYSDLSATRI